MPFSSTAFVNVETSVANEPDTLITNEPLLFDVSVVLLNKSTVFALVTTNVGCKTVINFLPQLPDATSATGKSRE